ncbi:Hypothetical protein Emin_0615 [Elusimicrobium minutum Pei191]|uniref:Flavin reductase like domain-containing protein n=1 Tax=Elusimicrobium minutum (strain Pei191) TaxID=445932 RepID=B2KC43_ELUMP|nr:flavin reductase [Elusimicrobium minutum]ACC98170.1 Hypothetical protein Emin_0615 [Elusimicrobium minutum Pei191]
MQFSDLFKQISTKDICAGFDIFKLVGNDFFLITSGNKDNYNSMTGSGGGFGMLFRTPSTWCVIRSDRYTLELIQKEKTYTLSYFTDEYKDQLIFLGNKTGRGTDKMKEVKLTSVQTPSGNITFKEAKLIIECKLTQITMPHPNDFYSQEARDYLTEAYKNPSDYRKYVFGEITAIWENNIKK